MLPEQANVTPESDRYAQILTDHFMRVSLDHNTVPLIGDVMHFVFPKGEAGIVVLEGDDQGALGQCVYCSSRLTNVLVPGKQYDFYIEPDQSFSIYPGESEEYGELENDLAKLRSVDAQYWHLANQEVARARKRYLDERYHNEQLRERYSDTKVARRNYVALAGVWPMVAAAIQSSAGEWKNSDFIEVVYLTVQLMPIIKALMENRKLKAIDQSLSESGLDEYKEQFIRAYNSLIPLGVFDIV